MSVATITPAKVAKVAKVTPAKVEPVKVDVNAEVAKLRKQWTLADKSETDTRKLFEAADIAWQNARVIKTRVAYAAAMVTPVPNGPDKGKANLLAATRFLLLSDEERALTPAKIKPLAVSRKSTLRNYVAAGEALQEAGLANKTGEPDANERKIVADVFREMNKRDKEDSKGEGQADDTLDGENTPLKDDAPADESLTFVDMVGHVAKMNKILDMLSAASIPVSEQEASAMADMLNEFQIKLSAYAEGK